MRKTNPISIRKATPQDALTITQIHQTAYKVSYKGFLPDKFLDSLHIDDDLINHTQQYLTKAECYIASMENNTAGFLYVSYPEENTLELQALYIHPQYQKCGVGTALIANLWETKAKKYNRYVVWTMKHGPSLKFYQKLGFTLTPNEKTWKFDIPIVMLEKNI